jgi:hypothetical protein
MAHSSEEHTGEVEIQIQWGGTSPVCSRAPGVSLDV